MNNLPKVVPKVEKYRLKIQRYFMSCINDAAKIEQVQIAVLLLHLHYAAGTCNHVTVSVMLRPLVIRR